MLYYITSSQLKGKRNERDRKRERERQRTNLTNWTGIMACEHSQHWMNVAHKIWRCIVKFTNMNRNYVPFILWQALDKWRFSLIFMFNFIVFTGLFLHRLVLLVFCVCLSCYLCICIWFKSRKLEIEAHAESIVGTVRHLPLYV